MFIGYDPEIFGEDVDLSELEMTQDNFVHVITEWHELVGKGCQEIMLRKDNDTIFVEEYKLHC